MIFELTQEMFDWIITDTERTPEQIKKLFNVGDTMRAFNALSVDETLIMCQNQNYKEIWLPVEFLPKAKDK